MKGTRAVQVNIHEAKTHLSRLLARVARGEEVIIAKSGRPLAKLVPLPALRTKRKFGLDAGKVWIADDFDELPPDFLEEFYK